jgi:hypothetical protein
MSDALRLVLLGMGVAGVGLVFLRAAGLPCARPWLPTVLGLLPLTGLALVGVIAFLLAFAGIGLHLWIVLPAALLVALAGSARLPRSDRLGALAPPESTRAGRLAEAAGVAVLVGQGAAVCAWFAVRPLDVWDGWAIWAAHSHALYVDGDTWGPVFRSGEYAMQHPEYPGVFPALQALVAEAVGRFDMFLIHLVPGVVLAAFGLAVWALLRLTVVPWFAALSGIAASGVPALVANAGANYADAVLAAFVAAGVLCLATWLRQPATAVLVLSAPFLAAGALLKREGLLFVLAGLVAAAVVTPRTRDRLRALAVLAFLTVAPAVLWTVVASSGGTRGAEFDYTSLLDPSGLGGEVRRARLSASTMLGSMADHWTYAVVISLLAVLAALLTGRRREAGFVVGWVGLSLAGLLATYATSTIDIGWYLATSADRVVFTVALGAAVIAPVLVGAALEELRVPRRRAAGAVGEPH